MRHGWRLLSIPHFSPMKKHAQKLIAVCLMLFASIIHADTKWYPGHYQTVMSLASTGKPAAWERPEVKAFLESPRSAGLMLRIHWRELEPVRGQFDFSQVESVIKTLAIYNKHMILNIVDRSFANERGGNAPDYVNRAGCMFPMPNQKTPAKNDVKGLALKSYRADCMALFIAFYQALGKRYDSDKRLWAVTIGAGESALDARAQKDFTSAETRQTLLLKAAREVKSAFPTTLALTGCNYLPVNAKGKEFAETLETIGGSGLTHPDTVPGHDFPCTPIESDFHTRLAVVPQLQLSQVNPKDPNLAHQLFHWSTVRIGAHALIWPNGYAQKTIAFLKSPDSDWPAHQQDCPSSLKPCITTQ